MDGLLERDRELAALDRLIADAGDGRGRVALIEGPAGIGKSRLLAEARTRARGMTVLSARRSFAVLHGLHWAVLDLAEERTVLLAIDDL